MEKGIHRRSLLRKPSFLEIDDDSDRGGDERKSVLRLDNDNEDSFLDFARESFDTVR